MTRQADQQPTPLELHQVFEEIAALEAQYVPLEAQYVPPEPQPQPKLQPQPNPQPRPQPEPRPQRATAPAAPRPARPDPAPGVVHQPAVRPAEPTLHVSPAQGASASAPQDPLFDFSPPAPPSQPMPAADPFTPAGSRPAHSGKRYLLWGGCLLAGALLIQGGRWLYQERGDTVAPGLARGAATGQQAVPLKRLDTGADDRPAQPVVSARRPADDVPPLVMLEADPPAAAPVERPPVEDRAEPESAPVPPKPASQATRKEPAAAAKAARTTDRSGPVRPVGGAPAAGTPGQASRDSAMAATLQACRAYGYDAAQCVKRACSITRYGFACRGR